MEYRLDQSTISRFPLQELLDIEIVAATAPADRACLHHEPLERSGGQAFDLVDDLPCRIDRSTGSSLARVAVRDSLTDDALDRRHVRA